MGTAPGVTVGLDIGTTSVKAVAADGDGTVLARARVPHPLSVPSPTRLEHDIDLAWRGGVERAFAEVTAPLREKVLAVQVAAMVPSLGALDRDGRPAGPGLLYGDDRGRPPSAASAGTEGAGTPAERGELVGFLAWLRAECPHAERFWPAQAVANHALCGRGAIDTATAFTAHPLFDGTRWDPALAAELGVDPAALPDVVIGTNPAGETAEGVLVGGGTIDAMGEQIVAGADADGDVLVICGTTLITWIVSSDWVEVPGLWTIPHTTPGKVLIGGPSNAGGLFLNWAASIAGEMTGTGLRDRDAEQDATRGGDHDELPVWLPYVRGERTPLHRHDLRAELHGLSLVHGPEQIRRAAYESAGFVVRHHLDRAAGAATPRRIVATGGGTRLEPWVRALADCTSLPVDVVAVPEGGALGAAFMARCTAGLETQLSDGSRWAAIDRSLEPDPTRAARASRRYERFRDLTDTALARYA